MTFLKVSGITKQIDTRFILNDVSFSQKKYQSLVIAGVTGSGKSTLLKMIAGLVQPDTGEITFAAGKVLGPEQKLVPGHTGIAYLSQDFELSQFLRVEQVLAYANALSEEECDIVYEICEISHLLTRKTDQLSGGERQRVAIARLLITSPELLLLDEPFSNLDMVHKNTLKSVINLIGKRLKITCILVSHDPDDILPWADKILVMKDGCIRQSGTPQKIYNEPVDEYTAGLFGNYNLIDISDAALFSIRAETKQKRKTLFLRPERFTFVSKGRKAAKGKVNAVHYLGSHDEVEVDFNEFSITLKSPHGQVQIGQTVFVEVDGDTQHYF